jgi:peptide/nickel transport system substrate-binding protein
MNTFGSAQRFTLSRRQLLAGAAALTVMPKPAFAGDEPKKGGVFRIGVVSGDISETLDPTGLSGSLGQMIMMMTRNALVEILPDGKLGPELAEHWEPDTELKTWTFDLRKGVKFHKGQAFTSADVVYSINYHRAEHSRSPLRSVLADVSSIKADGPNRVIIELKGPNADFPFVLADYAMRIVPDGTTSFIDGNGTGPYVLTSFNEGVRATGKRNPDYFKSDRAHFDEINLQVIPDESARIAALRSGVIDAMDRVSYKILPMVASLPGIRIIDVPGMQHFTFAMLCDGDPFKNPDLRTAMKYAIDREAIVKLILNGKGYAGNDQPISRIARYFNPEIQQRTFDADKAKFYLNKAGASGQAFKLHVSEAAFVGCTDMGALYSGSAAKAGVKIEIVKEPDDGYWSSVWQKVPWFSAYWSGRPTEDWMLTSTYSKGSPYNETHWSNEKFNQLLVAARGERDEAKRKQMYWDMQQIIHDDGGPVIPVFANYVTLASEKVAFGQLSPMWKMDGYKATERWWFRA